MTQNFYGLADCHGLESFNFELSELSSEFFMPGEDIRKKSDEIFANCLRAQANAQRHAVVYRVSIDEEAAAEVESLMEDGKYVEALKKLKETAEEVQLATYGTTKTAAENNWNMIPNPSLDPYYSKK
jgi:hypothetical protein